MMFLLVLMGWSLTLPTPKVETLPNGLTVAWFVSDSLPVVDLGLMIEAGYKEDPKGASGTAKLLSLMLERGSGGRTAKEVALSIEKLGAVSGVSVDDDTFSLVTHGLSTDAGALMEHLALLTLKPNLDLTEVQEQKARMLDTWRHLSDYGQSLGSVLFHRVMTSGTPYGRGGFYSERQFEKVGLAELKAYHSKYFVPSRATLMVVGQVNPKEFAPVIKKVWGGWKGKAQESKPVLHKNTVLLPGKKSGVLVGRKGLTQAHIQAGLKIPGVQDEGRYPMAVLNALLGETFYSRLNQRIRDELGLTYGIGSSLSYSKEFAYLSIAASTRNEAAEQVLVEIRKILGELAKGRIKAEEVDQAKTFLRGSFPLQVSTLGAIASRWLAGQIYDLGDDFLNAYDPKIGAVTHAQVVAQAKRVLKVEELQVVVAGDLGVLKKGKLGKLKVVPLSDLRNPK